MYFYIDLSIVSAGISHQISNFRSILNYCYMNNYKLIKPIYKLNGKHNNNKEIKTDLTKYYNFDNIYVDGKKFKFYDNDLKKYNNKDVKKYKAKVIQLKRDPLFKNCKEYDIKFTYNKKITESADIISKMLKKYICIHVRRGDALKNETIKKATSPENIIKQINNYNKDETYNVYIMTNNINDFKSLFNINFIYFHKDFNIKYLNEIKNDNYYIYCIENCIMDKANIRISTFNTRLRDINYNYYNYFLLNNKGWS